MMLSMKAASAVVKVQWVGAVDDGGGGLEGCGYFAVAGT